MNASEGSTTAVCTQTAQTALGLTVAHATRDLKGTVGHVVILMNVRREKTIAADTHSAQTMLAHSIANARKDLKAMGGSALM